MQSEAFWRADEARGEEVLNPLARAADRADVRLERRLKRFRTRIEIEKRKWFA